MTRHPFLESFSRSTVLQSSEDEHEKEVLDALKNEAYENGYASGWDDALASNEAAKSRVEAEFERNIQNLSLTYIEAVTHVRSELQGFVDALVETLLPSLSSDLICLNLKSQLIDTGKQCISEPAQIIASQDCYQHVKTMLSSEFSSEFEVIQDQSLGRGQVFFKVGGKENQIDLESVLEGISIQLRAMISDKNESEEKNER